MSTQLSMSDNNNESSITTYSENPYTFGRIIDKTKNYLNDNKYNKTKMEKLSEEFYNEYGLEKDEVIELDNESMNENDKESYFKEESDESTILEDERKDSVDDEDEEDEREVKGGGSKSKGKRYKKYGDNIQYWMKKNKRDESDASEDSDDSGSDSDDNRYVSTSRSKLLKKAFNSYRNQIPNYRKGTLKPAETFPEDSIPKNYSGLMPNWYNNNNNQQEKHQYDTQSMFNPSFKYHMNSKQNNNNNMYAAPSFLKDNVDPIINPYTSNNFSVEIESPHYVQGGGKQMRKKVLYYDQSKHPYLNQNEFAKQLFDSNYSNKQDFFFQT